jgi:hypothetical protein
MWRTERTKDKDYVLVCAFWLYCIDGAVSFLQMLGKKSGLLLQGQECLP